MTGFMENNKDDYDDDGDELSAVQQRTNTDMFYDVPLSFKLANCTLRS
jgi:hypothetical protein